jgi:hypothetical protein
MNQQIKKELETISDLLNSGNLTSAHYEQLYSAQQGIVWSVNPESAKSPVETVMNNLVQAPVTDTQANLADCLVVHRQPLS